MRRLIRLNAIILLIIAGAVTVLFVALGLVNQNAENKAAAEQFEAEKVFLTRQMANSLVLPLWNLDMSEVRVLAQGLMEEPSVSSLSIGVNENDDRTISFGRGHDGDPIETREFMRGDAKNTNERPIVKDGVVLGSLTVVFTPDGMNDVLARRVWYMIETVGMLNVLLVVLLTVAVRTIVLQPLRFLERYAEAVSRGEAVLPQPKGVVFLGELVGLRSSITTMYEQLQERYLALKSSEEELRSSRERFILAIEGSDSGLWDWDVATGTVFFAPRWKTMLGYDEPDLPDRYETWIDLLHAEDKPRCLNYMAKFLEHPTDLYENEYRLRQKDGSYRWVLSKARAQVDSDGKPFRLTGSNTDIQARKEAEESIQTALREKTILLQEIHHRVKNNLQIVSSLLLLQAAHSKNEDTIAALETMRLRIHSMALLHETLYLNANLSNISFPDYLERLVQHLMNSIGPAVSRVSIDLDIPQVEFDMDMTVTLGLLINEIITNAVKHAFPQDRHGRIHIALTSHRNHFVLSVEDDGVGFAEGLDPDSLSSLGLKLIQMMTAKLQADFTRSGPGTRYEFRFARMRERHA
jgi:PAS domain S-box-containing protein